MESLPVIPMDCAALYLRQKVCVNDATTLKLSNGVLVRVPIITYYYHQTIALFVILLAETPSPYCNFT